MPHVAALTLTPSSSETPKCYVTLLRSSPDDIGRVIRLWGSVVNVFCRNATRNVGKMVVVLYGGGVVCNVVCAFHIVRWWLYISYCDILGKGVGEVVFTLVEGS